MVHSGAMAGRQRVIPMLALTFSSGLMYL